MAPSSTLPVTMQNPPDQSIKLTVHTVNKMKSFSKGLKCYCL